MAKPEWLKIKAQSSEELLRVEKLISELALNTVCDEAACPNRLECFGRRTATFMILGKRCTRNCAFCNVETAEGGEAADASGGKAKGGASADASGEPGKVAEAVKILGLKHVVITSVTRDDLPDGGAAQFVAVIAELRKIPNLTIEVLIPDFAGNEAALLSVVAAKPDIIGHNVETVPRLYPTVRANADFERSLRLLSQIKATAPAILTKSSVMLGLGETRDELLLVFRALREVGCDLLCIGQYLAPSKAHHPVVTYIPPADFDELRQLALEMGFKFVASGPFVRSSYHADEALK